MQQESAESSAKEASPKQENPSPARQQENGGAEEPPPPPPPPQQQPPPTQPPGSVEAPSNGAPSPREPEEGQPLPSNVLPKQQQQQQNNEFLQQQSQIFVFSTALANQGADAVIQRQYPSIISFHCAQPGTKQYLEKNPLRTSQFNRQPWMSKRSSLAGVQVPDENLTPQQRQHREEQLATLRKMQQILFPERATHPLRSASAPIASPGAPASPAGHSLPAASPSTPLAGASPSPGIKKEASLMPVPSPQQIQYLAAFEGHELTIQRQPNTGITDPHLLSPMQPSGMDDPNRPLAPSYPSTPNFGSPSDVKKQPQSPSDVKPRFGTDIKQSFPPDVKPCFPPGPGSQAPPMSPSSFQKNSPAFPPEMPSPPKLSPPPDIPLNPVGPQGGNKGRFDPITSMEAMSQQLASPGPNMMPPMMYGSPQEAMCAGGGQQPPSQGPPQQQQQQPPPQMGPQQGFPPNVPMMPNQPSSPMMQQPRGSPPVNYNPMGPQMGPRPMMGPQQCRPPYNGANIQVKPSAPNTIQYHPPTRPQSQQPQGPPARPSLDFLHRFANPQGGPPDSNKMGYFPNGGPMNGAGPMGSPGVPMGGPMGSPMGGPMSGPMGPGGHSGPMNPGNQMGPMGPSGTMGPGGMGPGMMGSGPMGPGPMGSGPMGQMGPGPMGQMGPGPMGPGGMGPGPMCGNNPMGPGPMGPMGQNMGPGGPMGGPMGPGGQMMGPMGPGQMGGGGPMGPMGVRNRQPMPMRPQQMFTPQMDYQDSVSQPLPPSMGAPFGKGGYVGPSAAADPNYAQQYHNFQQQLYATNTRAQSGAPGPPQPFFK